MVHSWNPPQVRYWTTEHLNSRACGHLEMRAFAHAVHRSLGTVQTPSAGAAEWLTTPRFSLWAPEQPRYRSIGQANIRWTGHATTRPCEVSHNSAILMAELRTIESVRMLSAPIGAAERQSGPLKPTAVYRAPAIARTPRGGAATSRRRSSGEGASGRRGLVEEGGCHHDRGHASAGPTRHSGASSGGPALRGRTSLSVIRSLWCQCTGHEARSGTIPGLEDQWDRGWR